MLVELFSISERIVTGLARRMRLESDSTRALQVVVGRLGENIGK